ncbi:hypothetical protein QS416_12455 [Staphylococcus pseudintermedius]|uniref:hypothetical protein n=1 Tax=Staphylococcus pseudintermedius TaxID=283734 RepID=UPI00286E9900|nr:hypothetical protein [Staphylococcus pseudintermedius]WMZ64513.1 hypothetical protein QS416_12455 [Staphylococcus pseudintermedius]
MTAESCCAFQGAAPPTKFGLIEMYAGWKTNWILGAVQKGYIKTIGELNQKVQLTNERSTDSIWLPFDCLYDIKI